MLMVRRKDSGQTLSQLITLYKRNVSAFGARPTAGIIGDVTRRPNVELEVRFHNITHEIFMNLGRAMTIGTEWTNPRVSTTINVISAGSTVGMADGNVVQEISFVDGVKSGTTYTHKVTLGRPVRVREFIDYIISVARETPIDEVPASTEAIARVKCRLSLDYATSDGGKWRIDLTATRQGPMQYIGPVLKTIRDKVFPTGGRLTPATYFDHVHELRNEFTAWEVEAEYVSSTGGAELTPEMIIGVAHSILVLVNPNYLTDAAYVTEIQRIGSILGIDPMQGRRAPASLKQVSNQAIAISKNTYLTEIYPPVGYFVTDKADGERAIVVVADGVVRFVTQTTLYEVAGDPSSGATTSGGSPQGVTIVDGEMFIEDDKYRLFVFDCLVVNGEEIHKHGFSVRREYIDRACEIINAVGGAKSTTEGRSSVVATAKKFYEIGSADPDVIKRAVMGAYDAGDDKQYRVDGVILTEPGADYMGTRNYKWKPADDNTIDFTAMRCPQNLLGTAPYTTTVDGSQLYLLFVGINHRMRENLGIGLIPHIKEIFADVDLSVTTSVVSDSRAYYPVQFSPSVSPLAYIWERKPNSGEVADPATEDLHGKIVELSYDTSRGEWVFHRVREDRRLDKGYFGNDFRIAEITFMNFVDKFEIEDLWQPAPGYFQAAKVSDMYSASNKFKRFVISRVFASNIPQGTGWVLDLAAGRGADLHRYRELGVRHVVFVDVDKGAISELVKRKLSLGAPAKRRIGGDDLRLPFDRTVIDVDKLFQFRSGPGAKHTTIGALVADLKTPWRDTAEKISALGINESGADVVVCNFALHYMCDSDNTIDNFFHLVANKIKVGGVFIFTVMDGQKVYDLLARQPDGLWESFELRPDGSRVLKYAIKAGYKTGRGVTGAEQFTRIGQMISVKLPFSTDLVDEPLCNLNYVTSVASRMGLEVELNSSFASYIDAIRVGAPFVADALTEEDKNYIALHSIVTMRMVTKTKKR